MMNHPKEIYLIDTVINNNTWSMIYCNL